MAKSIGGLTNTLTAATASATAAYLPVEQTSTSYKMTLRELRKATAGAVNVRDYGAVGDGATDDTSAIQTAIDTGQNVFFPHGRYLVSSTLNVTDDYQCLFADGHSGRILCSITDGTACIKVSNADHVTISGIRIIESGGASIKNFIGIEFDTSISWYLENTYMQYAATGYKFVDSFIGTAVNVWHKYGTLGISGSAFNDVHGDFHIENCAQAFVLNEAHGTTMTLMIQGESRTTASTLDDARGFRILNWYIENNLTDPSTVPELAIGGTTACYNVEVNMQATYNTSIQCPVVTLDQVDGCKISGFIGKSVWREYVTTTSNTKNLSLNIIDGSTNAKQCPVPANTSLITPVNLHPDPYYWTAIPATTGASGATASEETTIVCPWTVRSMKVDATTGTFNQVAHDLTFANFPHLAITKGLKVGAATWVYVPDVSFYTMNSAGPTFILEPNGTGAVNSSQAANGGEQNNVLFVKGDWALITVEATVPTDATQIKLRYYCNNSGTAATADTYCYFGGTLLWIGGRALTQKVQNGILSHHASVWS